MVTIPTIDQISGTTVMNKMRSLITNYIDFGTQVAGELSYMMNVIENLPQDITDVYNKATIDAMFANVYQKSETYSKAEVNDLISTIGSFHAVIVDSLPQYGDEGVIYLLKIAESGENRYKEYIWVNRWELIGELSNVDLNNYYTKSQADTLLNTKVTGSGNIGNDTKPVKIVNGTATPVTDDLIKKSSLFFTEGSSITTPSSYVYYGFVDTTTRVFININLPKLLDRPFTLTITSMEVKGVNGSFTINSNPISNIQTNNQTFDTIRVSITFTNPHGLTVNTPISGFITFTLTAN